MRGVNDYSGTVERYVKPSEVGWSSNWQVFEAGLNASEKRAFDKYRQLYRKGKERAWPGLPRCGYFNGKLVLNDGTHRFMSAIAEGATQVLCAVDEPAASSKPKQQDVRVKAPGDSLGVLITKQGIYEPGVGSYTPAQARKRASTLRKAGQTARAESLEMAADQLGKKGSKSLKDLRSKYRRKEG